jgi:tRNA-dihydrouridine synthase B
MAEAARYNSSRGAQIIDINMGCPAKKVCAVAAGSALLKNEPLVKEILETVVAAVDIPVTLKIRTGWDPEHRNALKIAQIAENSGIAALTIHGRTRSCGFSGLAEYETIRQVKHAVKIPVVANGDIDSPEKAKSVLDFTGADAIMIGRPAQGRPWIFEEINHYLTHMETLPQRPVDEIRSILRNHLEKLYSFYGQITGVRIARKHIAWYFKNFKPIPADVKQQINKADSPAQQTALVESVLLLINNGFSA